MLIDFEGKKIELKPTKIVAVAKNYRAHAVEMGGTAPEEPKFFLKPPSSLIGHKGVVILPSISQRVDYEVELGVLIKHPTKNISVNDASKNILGYTITVDITARDIQNEAKKAGMPWTIAKGFDTFAPTGPCILSPDRFDPSGADLWLKINGELKQHGNTRDMVHSVYGLIAYISRVMTLEPLDLIATGTPEGIGPMKHGDFIEAGIDGIGVLEFTVEKNKDKDKEM